MVRGARGGLGNAFPEIAAQGATRAGRDRRRTRAELRLLADFRAFRGIPCQLESRQASVFLPRPPEDLALWART